MTAPTKKDKDEARYVAAAAKLLHPGFGAQVFRKIWMRSLTSSRGSTHKVRFTARSEMYVGKDS